MAVPVGFQIYYTSRYEDDVFHNCLYSTDDHIDEDY